MNGKKTAAAIEFSQWRRLVLTIGSVLSNQIFAAGQDFFGAVSEIDSRRVTFLVRNPGLQHKSSPKLAVPKNPRGLISYSAENSEEPGCGVNVSRASALNNLGGGNPGVALGCPEQVRTYATHSFILKTGVRRAPSRRGSRA